MLSRQRILEAVLREFSQKGYEGASLNTVCAENGISKGIVYHYFKDKDELYLFCAADCFEKLTAYLKGTAEAAGHPEERLRGYFDARLRFFAEAPAYLGIFLVLFCILPRIWRKSLQRFADRLTSRILPF